MEPKVEIKEKKGFSLMKLWRMFGPAVIIAASIIGPGTVTTASVTGAEYRYMLIWTMILTPILAYIFEEPAIRFTLIKGKTLFEGIHDYIHPLASKISFFAIFMGALAYQAGNYMGASMAMNYLVPGLSIQTCMMILAVFAVVLSLIGKYAVIEKTNLILVLLMTVAFLITMFGSKPDIIGVASGLIPRIPKGGEILALGLVATTMCPDIPFALSSLTKKRWTNGISDMKPAREDLRLNMVITGIVGCAVMICSATVINPMGIQVTSAADMAMQLTPILGRYAGVLFALGLWSAGFSSGLYMASCVPPMMNEAMGWSNKTEKSPASRFCMFFIGLVPVVVGYLFGAMPVGVIVAAQTLNGFLLPVTVIFIAILCNKKSILGDKVNTPKQNIALAVVGIVVVLVTIVAIPSIVTNIGSLFG